MSSINPDDPKTKKMLLQMATEQEAIVSSIGLVTRVWATLESNLAETFQILGTFDESRRDVAGIIFYTPSNTETRLSLVDRLVTYRCEFAWLGRNTIPDASLAKSQIDEPLCRVWSSIKGKTDALKSTRNAIVHGVITNSARASDLHGQTARLTPALGDLMRFLPPVYRGQHPGYGSNELKIHEQAVWRVNERVHRLNEAFRLRMQVQLGPDHDEAARKLLELLPRLEPQMSSQNNPDQESLDKSDPDGSSQG